MTMTMAAIGTKSAGAVVAIFLPRAAIAENIFTIVALLREATSRIVRRFDAKRVRKVSAGWTGDPSASVTLHTCSAVVACKAVTIVALCCYIYTIPATRIFARVAEASLKTLEANVIGTISAIISAFFTTGDTAKGAFLQRWAARFAPRAAAMLSTNGTFYWFVLVVNRQNFYRSHQIAKKAATVGTNGLIIKESTGFR